ncbi:TPA: hypothetical protein ACTNSS_004591, partial [Salmonella enterica subsp. enterica serovar Enteritidis]
IIWFPLFPESVFFSENCPFSSSLSESKLPAVEKKKSHLKKLERKNVIKKEVMSKYLSGHCQYRTN